MYTHTPTTHTRLCMASMQVHFLHGMHIVEFISLYTMIMLLLLRPDNPRTYTSLASFALRVKRMKKELHNKRLL